MATDLSTQPPQPDSAGGASAAPGPVVLDQGTYEVLRQRLQRRQQELKEKLQQLNAARKEVFGTLESTLVATEHITTPNNCTASDLVAVGANRFLFGFNVFIGLKSQTTVRDVFAAYEKRDHTFSPLPLDLIAHRDFETDFRELYRYYKNPTFVKFSIQGPRLFMLFRVGQNETDIKTFQWLIQADQLLYQGHRGDHELRTPPQHEFEWKRTHRDFHRGGKYPHISIEDRVFVETIGGDLTVKVEDNTETGTGIYSETVEHRDQTLDDAEVFYSILGHLVLLKIRPYQEDRFRYLVFNGKLQQVQRIDAIEDACVLLPHDQGIIFSNGYYLQLGEFKQFPTGLAHMVFEQRLAAPNGEDHLFVFYNRREGLYVLMSYNIITQKIESPILCNGYCLFPNGEMALFRAGHEPQKHHALQIWQTPYLHPDFTLAATQKKDDFLFKLGNATLVNCMSECHELLALLEKEDSYGDLYVDVVKASSEVMDTYFWLDRSEAFHLRATLEAIRETATAAIAEFEKVRRLKRQAQSEFNRIAQQAREQLETAALGPFSHIDDYVRCLGRLRGLRGELVGLKDVRYMDIAGVEQLESEITSRQEVLSRQCVEFLLGDEALAPFQARVRQHEAHLAGLDKVALVRQEEQAVQQTAGELEMLIETVSNLKIDDPTQTTRIIDGISSVYALLNQVRHALKRRRQELQTVEGAAQFTAQLRLVEQSVANYLEICDTPERCEEYLNKVMVQVEELEGQCADLEDFLLKLAEKREEIYSAFESRKLALVESRGRRAQALMAAADRIFQGLHHRVSRFESVAEIHGYFASDLMVDRIRALVRQLAELNENVRADDLQTRLKTLREEAVRQLKDRQELFVRGQPILQLGKHRFTVNTQKLELTVVPRDPDLCFHLTSTAFFETITDPELLSTRPVWTQELVSETRELYRAEYLAYQALRALETATTEPTAPQAAAWSDAECLVFVQQFQSGRYAEGYVKGLHDQDAARILRCLLSMRLTAGMLRYSPASRACATVFWHCQKSQLPLLAAHLKGLRVRRELFPQPSAHPPCVQELQQHLDEFIRQTGLFAPTVSQEAAEYLFYELTSRTQFVISREATRLYRSLQEHLAQTHSSNRLEDLLQAVATDPLKAMQLLRDWITGFLQIQKIPGSEAFIDETASLLLRRGFDPDAVANASFQATLTGMAGTHPVLVNQSYELNYHAFLARLQSHEREIIPLFRHWQERKALLLEKKRQALRLKSFEPRVLTSFVRNRLIDRVYLPLIGDNLAKQIGVAGEETRTDRMGLLLLLSPPGYGKTTLMEYVASRLGLTFIKINGPALGAQVTAFDPAEVRQATAREELRRLNLAFEMGDNIMIYVDDIQHCHPEFLQKFISLCDAQRRVEGVYEGQARTYDLRGRKIAVVMAGNPYTESGEKFKVPDMLTNRADTYNLGDIIADAEDAFKESYLENALTSSPVLNRLASRSQKDAQAVIQLAGGSPRDAVDFEGAYSVPELNEFVAVMQKLIRIRDVVLRINQEYIRSAAQTEAYRTEPPFKLQGSYRNMNRMAERVLPVMNDDEIQALILDHYQNEAQTLASGAEANLLKFKELLGLLSPVETERWKEIQRTFQRNLLFHEAGAQDPVGRIVAQLAAFSEGLESIRSTLANRPQPDQSPAHPELPAPTIPQLDKLALELESLRNTISSALQKQPQQPLFRLQDPSRKADYEITQVTQDTLRKIWAVIEEDRSASQTPPPARPRE